ncbi:STAS domain-containing protein [Streptomyces erythrochromogenes]
MADCSRVTFCDSSGLNALIAARLQAVEAGTTIHLANPAPQLQRLLQMTGAAPSSPAKTLPGLVQPPPSNRHPAPPGNPRTTDSCSDRPGPAAAHGMEVSRFPAASRRPPRPLPGYPDTRPHAHPVPARSEPRQT